MAWKFIGPRFSASERGNGSRWRRSIRRKGSGQDQQTYSEPLGGKLLGVTVRWGGSSEEFWGERPVILNLNQKIAKQKST